MDTVCETVFCEGLVRDCSISSAKALEILQSCAKPSNWRFTFATVHCMLYEVIIDHNIINTRDLKVFRIWPHYSCPQADFHKGVFHENKINIPLFSLNDIYQILHTLKFQWSNNLVIKELSWCFASWLPTTPWVCRGLCRTDTAGWPGMTSS